MVCASLIILAIIFFPRLLVEFACRHKVVTLNLTGVVLNGAVLRNVQERLRYKLQNVGHHTQIGIEVAHGLLSLLAFEAGKLEHLQSMCLSGLAQHVGFCTCFFGASKHGGDLIAARQKCFERCLAEILLSDECDSHKTVPFDWSRLCCLVQQEIPGQKVQDKCENLFQGADVHAVGRARPQGG